jgi:uncharacterized membrane protein
MSVPEPTFDFTINEVRQALADEGISPIKIGGLEIPLSAGSFTNLVWALLNLIFAFTGIVLGLITAARIFVRKRRGHHKAQSATQRHQNGETTENKKQLRPIAFIAAIVLAIVCIVFFILTEDMTRLMVLTDNWTLLSLAILVIEIVAVCFSFKRQGTISADSNSEYKCINATPAIR